MSVVSCQFSVVSFQLSVFSFQFSVVSFQLSVSVSKFQVSGSRSTRHSPYDFHPDRSVRILFRLASVASRADAEWRDLLFAGSVQADVRFRTQKSRRVRHKPSLRAEARVIWIDDPEPASADGTLRPTHSKPTNEWGTRQTFSISFPLWESPITLVSPRAHSSRTDLVRKLNWKHRR